MATSMAAALAASIPAPQAPTPPQQPTYQAIPPSMSKLIDIEGEISLTNVQLDGLAVTKIVKHSRDSRPSTAIGLLVGIDLDGTLQVTNCVPLPHNAFENDDGDKSAKALARYQASMLRGLRDVQGDDAVVGFYYSASLGAFYTHNLVELQAIHQEKLRHGGIVVVHDVTQTARGNAIFRAFKLTKNFMKASKKGKFNTRSLIENKLTFSTLIDELPLKIRVNPLLGAFLTTLTEPSFSSSSASIPPKPATLQPHLNSSFDLAPIGLTQNLERILESLDDYKTEEGNIAYLTRQIARERARAEAHLLKRREENAALVAQGLPPLPEDDVSRLFKIPPEPSRLESVLLLGQVDAYAKSLADTASVGLVKMFAANAQMPSP